MRRLSLILLLTLLLPLAGGAADMSSSPPEVDDPLARTRESLQRKDWRAAEQELRAVLAKQPRLANAHNLLGYSLRHQRRYDEALAAYAKVFEIEPKHLGAHEYIGQAYVELGRLPEAEKHLSTLQQLCSRCEETRDLAASLAKAKAARPASAL